VKRIYAAALAVAFLGLAVTSFAWGPQGRGVGMGPGNASYLNLSEDQAKEMAAIRDHYYNETAQARNDLFQRRGELQRLYADPKADAGKITAKQGEVRALRQAMYDAMNQARIEQRNIFTPGQIEKLGTAPAGQGLGYRKMGFYQ